MYYDYLIVGAGLFGSIFARELTDKGYSCLVVDRRRHIGGNCFTENIEGINVHKYGPHIFHTSNKEVWEYVNKFTQFNHYTHRPKVTYRDKIYSFPINLMTLYQIYGVSTPEQALKKLEEVKVQKTKGRGNLEEWILSQVGPEVYEIFIKGYTTKQWNREPSKLPAGIITRLPIRLTYDDNYFNDIYQGIPIGGYTQIFEKLLDGIEVRLGVDYLEHRYLFDKMARKIVYTGPVDAFYEYKFGKLEYRSLKFEHEVLDKPDHQGVAIMNYTEEGIPYTRIVEHKHFEFGKQDKTVITREYPQDKGEPFYPINDVDNNTRYSKYKELMNAEENYIFGGRLADYKYYDMHQVVASALHEVKKELNR
jgi:UDP-galactopyranose mutase